MMQGTRRPAAASTTGARARRAAFALVLLLAVLAASLPAAGPAGAEPFLYPAIEAYWSRADLPVASGATQRSWMWGPEAFASGYETYKEGPNQRRQVQYFDKSRMEITRPWLMNKPEGITNGLLVVEMVSGHLQLGDAAFATGYTPAEEAVAGDPAQYNPVGPTYASFAGVATLNAVTNRAQPRIGQGVSATINRQGQVGDDASLAGAVQIAYFEENLAHNVPNVFWDFMNRSGLVFAVDRYKTGPQAGQPMTRPEGGLSGSLQTDTVVSWLEAMGFPITEPYWMKTRVGGVEKTVLVQLFERRVLTYTPDNDPAFQVEMGNVGRHYYAWRYSGLPVGATATTGGALRYKIIEVQPLGKQFNGGPGGSLPQTSNCDTDPAGTTCFFLLVRVTVTNVSSKPQKLARTLVIQAGNADGTQVRPPDDNATDAYNQLVTERPAKCPPGGCPQPPRIWTELKPNDTMTIGLVYDIPADAVRLRLVPSNEDAPPMVIR